METKDINCLFWKGEKPMGKNLDKSTAFKKAIENLVGIKDVVPDEYIDYSYNKAKVEYYDLDCDEDDPIAVEQAIEEYERQERTAVNSERMQYYDSLGVSRY